MKPKIYGIILGLLFIVFLLCIFIYLKTDSLESKINYIYLNIKESKICEKE